MSVNETQVLNTAIGRRLRSARLNRDSRQLGVRVADDKELLAADQAPDRGVSAGGFPASLGATEKVAERQNHHRPQALRKGTHHETARQ